MDHRFAHLVEAPHCMRKKRSPGTPHYRGPTDVSQESNLSLTDPLLTSFFCKTKTKQKHEGVAPPRSLAAPPAEQNTSHCLHFSGVTTRPVEAASYRETISVYICGARSLQRCWLPYVSWMGYQENVTSYGFHPLPREQICCLL